VEEEFWELKKKDLKLKKKDLELDCSRSEQDGKGLCLLNMQRVFQVKLMASLVPMLHHHSHYHHHSNHYCHCHCLLHLIMTTMTQIISPNQLEFQTTIFRSSSSPARTRTTRQQPRE